MKIKINNYPSTSPEKVVLVDPTNRDVFEVVEHCADDSTDKFTVSRADLEAAPKFRWPYSIPLVTVPKPASYKGAHQWLANGVVEKILAL